MEKLTDLFQALYSSDHDVRHSALFVGKVVALSLLDGCTSQDFNHLIENLASSCYARQFTFNRVVSLLEMAPGLSRVIATGVNVLPGQLRHNFPSFDVMFDIVVNYKENV